MNLTELYIVEALICLLKMHLSVNTEDKDILKAKENYIRSTVKMLESLKEIDDED